MPEDPRRPEETARPPFRERYPQPPPPWKRKPRGGENEASPAPDADRQDTGASPEHPEEHTT